MTDIKIVIPARYGSSRLPGKPLLEIDNQPMFWHVHSRCLLAGFKSEDIIVATDDTRIFDSASKYHIKAQLTELTHISGTDRINEVVNQQGFDKKTLVINVQGDEPLIPPELIRDLAEFACSNPKFDLSTVITPITNVGDMTNANVVKVAVGENDQAIYFSRSAIPKNRDDVTSLEHAYRHIGIYAYRVSTLNILCDLPESRLEKLEKLEQLRALSNGLSIGAKVCDEIPPHGVDNHADYINIKKIMESNGA